MPPGMPPFRSGLSPRMRGNPFFLGGIATSSGSIPAYAGEPLERACAAANDRVYPRVCGGTKATPLSVSRSRGLSPRMRGNRTATAAGNLIHGSIPAYAGEPASYARAALADAVYPRVCGGTGLRAAAPGLIKGLSPRMRGNHAKLVIRIHPAGSIPAYAGEPAAGVATSGVAAVYPRVCGGTQLTANRHANRAGLSPRMRGNRGELGSIRSSAGSIPAYAGEPG